MAQSLQGKVNRSMVIVAVMTGITISAATIVILFLSQMNIPLTTLATLMIALSLFAGFAAYLTGRHLTEQSANDLQTLQEAISEIVRGQDHRATEHLSLLTTHESTAELSGVVEQLGQIMSRQQKLTSVHELRIKEAHNKSEKVKLQLNSLRQLMNSAKMLIITADEQFNITFFNEFAQRFTGVKSEAILHRGLATVFPSGEWDEVNSAYQDILDGKNELVEHDSEIVDANGRIRTIWWLHSKFTENNISTLLTIGHDVTERKETEKRIVWLAGHDPITGMLNRNKFLEEFDKAIFEANRSQQTCCLLFIRIDEGSFGDDHNLPAKQTVDSLLQHLAQSLKTLTYYTDIQGRLSELELAIIKVDTDEIGAQILADQLLMSINTLSVSGLPGIQIRAHVGKVMFPVNHTSAQELLGYAELAMHQAKSKSPMNSACHTLSLEQSESGQDSQNTFWKQQIENALTENRFTLYYQPLLDLKTQTSNFFEVLIRMNDAETGEIRTAGSFIDIAEKLELIHLIDEFVLGSTLKTLLANRQQRPDLKLVINLSDRTLLNNRFIDQLGNALNKSQLPASCFNVKVSTHLALKNHDGVLQSLNRLKLLGCGIILDDFGLQTGIESQKLLSLLKSLPVTMVKISGNLIKNLLINDYDRLFVARVTKEAHNNNIQTIAEFVEEAPVLEALKTLEVDLAQGFFIGRPSAEMQTKK